MCLFEGEKINRIQICIWLLFGLLGEMDRNFTSYGFGRGTLRPKGDLNARVGGNDQEGLGSTPGGRNLREVPLFGRGRFAPGVCSTPMPQGESAPNTTQYEDGDMSITRGGEFDSFRGTPGFQQFYSLLQERQTILEGVVSRIEGEMGQYRGEISKMQGNISQVQGDLGAGSNRVDGLGQDVGALRGDIGLLRSDMTSQMGSMEKDMGNQLREITQMLAGVLRSDHTQSVTCTKEQEAKVTVSQPVVTSSQGSPWVPSSVPEHSLLIEQPVVRGSNSMPVSVHNPEVTSLTAAQSQPLSSVRYDTLGSGLPSTITCGSFSGYTQSGGYPIHPSKGASVSGHAAGDIGLPMTAPTASVCSSTSILGSQGSGCHGEFVGQSAALGGAHSFMHGIGVAQGHTLMTTADTTQFPSLIPPGTRSSVSRNIPAEVKWMKYNGDVEWGPFYSKFSTIAEYHQWSDPDCLFALSLTLEGAALKYFDILRRRGALLNFKEVVLRMEERFGKTSLRAASQLEFSSIAQRTDETIEQWGDRVMDTAQKAFGGGTSPEIFQEQLIVRFALGCSDGEAGQQLINNPPCTLTEAIKRVKTYQLSRKAVARRQRAVRSVSAERDWEGRRDSRSPPAHRSKTSNSARRDTSEDRGTGCSRGAGEGNRGRSPVRKPVGENHQDP